MDNDKIQITICLGSSCFSRGNRDTLEIIKKYISEKKLDAKVQFKGQLCSDMCNKGPIIWINQTEYQGVTPTSVISILNKEFGK